MKKKIYIFSIIYLIIDQISKILIELFIPVNKSIKIIPNFFNLTYVQNKGAAFSILTEQKILLISIGIVAIILLINFIKDFHNNKRNIIGFSILLGGIAGNIIDRLFFGYVRDFLDFKIFNYHYPTFNISDIGICIGVLLLLIAIIKGEESGSSRKRKNQNR